MKKIFPGLLLSLLFPAMLAAENTEESPRKPLSDANITGHVQDAATGEHLPYITVVVKGTTIGTATDGTGHYFLKNLPAGEFVLEASMLGYGTVEKRVTTTSGKTIEVNFVLTEDSERMDEIVVTANRNETNKKESSTIVNITSGKLFSAVGSSTLSESMNFTPGLRIENNCGNCAVTQLRINGLEGHYSQILLDSRPIFSSLATVYGLDQLPVSMIERVEVVRGGGSALYGANAIGGVVNIITKEPLYNTLNVSNITNVFGNGKLDINTSIGGAFVSDDHKAGMYIFGMVKERSPYDHNGDNFSDVPGIKSETVGFRGYYRTGLRSKLTAEYHHIHTGEVCRDLFLVVDHGEGHAAQGNGKIVGDIFCPFLVVVAADNVEGGVLLQLIHDALLVDVAAVENDIGGFQVLRYLRPQQAVGVGENSNFHRFFFVSFSASRSRRGRL